MKLFAQYTSVATLTEDYIPYPSGQVVNWPVVTPKSTFADTSTNPYKVGKTISSAWFAGYEVYYVDFGNISSSQISMTSSITPGNVATGNAVQFYDIDTGSKFDLTILDHLADDFAYSGLYLCKFIQQQACCVLLTNLLVFSLHNQQVLDLVLLTVQLLSMSFHPEQIDASK
ncbi:hypothetical protein HK100_008870 [Physocladia obscura]|uniref:Uncharacterized protein n=1 Tax=Physocladia obscura TaxID=109957 RepID=A0AAD5T3U3_9FUNG|nr:hypothetical protein HK100_008870 [Physocladia obscura]